MAPKIKEARSPLQSEGGHGGRGQRAQDLGVARGRACLGQISAGWGEEASRKGSRHPRTTGDPGWKEERGSSCPLPNPVLLRKKKKVIKRNICKLDSPSILLNHQKLLETSIMVLIPQMPEIPAWKALGASHSVLPAPEAGTGLPGLVCGLSQRANRRRVEPVASHPGFRLSDVCSIRGLGCVPHRRLSKPCPSLWGRECWGRGRQRGGREDGRERQ